MAWNFVTTPLRHKTHPDFKTTGLFWCAEGAGCRRTDPGPPRQMKKSESRNAKMRPKTLTRVWTIMCVFVAWPSVMPKLSLTFSEIFDYKSYAEDGANPGSAQVEKATTMVRG